MRHEPSEERLNALVDGELTPADAEELLRRMSADAALRDRVAELRLAKQLVRQNYAQVTPPRAAGNAGSARPRWPWAVAASLLAGVLVGWTAREQSASPVDSASPLRGEATHVVLHLSSASTQSGRAVLDDAEGILETARLAGRQVSVEIVANSGGLDLLRRETSAFAPRIAALRASYPGLALVACGQTAQRLRDAGTTVHLLPGTSEATSALDAIVLRMQQGWTYVRI